MAIKGNPAHVVRSMHSLRPATRGLSSSSGRIGRRVVIRPYLLRGASPSNRVMGRALSVVVMAMFLGIFRIQGSTDVRNRPHDETAHDNDSIAAVLPRFMSTLKSFYATYVGDCIEMLAWTESWLYVDARKTRRRHSRARLIPNLQHCWRAAQWCTRVHRRCHRQSSVKIA